MDFTNRETRPVTPVNTATTPAPSGNNKKKSDNGKWGRIGVVAAVTAVVILLVALSVLAATSNSSKNQGQYVDTSRMQAVFLNTGQVYFGNITSVADDSMVLNNIYYLQTANNSGTTSNTSNSNVTLVKLGCELHQPYDKMVINPGQVTFWENLQDNGQVAKAVAQFEKENPQGQKCADQSTSSSTDSGNAVQSAGNNNSSNSTNSTTNNNSTNNTTR